MINIEVYKKNKLISQSKLFIKGVRETNKTIPWLCFKQSKDNLKDEEEKKSLLIDVKLLVGKNPLIEPDYGYEKINVDMRQVP